MRLGLVARMDNSGLGIQTHEFYTHMKPDKTMVVDMSAHNSNRQYPERYPHNATFTHGLPTLGDIDEFLENLDVVFVAEAPYNYYLYERAREMGVKTAVQYNYEFFDWFKFEHFPVPDLLIAPSTWNYYHVDQWAREHGVQHTYLHCPVDRNKLPFRQIKQFKTFLHVAGRAAAHDRNGTLTVIQAAAHIKSDAVIKIHLQGQQGVGHQVTHTVDEYQAAADEVRKAGGHLLVVQQEYDNYADVYRDGDVLLMPRRYGGNCLPMNEALSCGMPVIMPDISPNYSFLEKSWLVPARVISQFEPRTVIDIYDVNAEALAAKIDEFANMPEDQALAHNSIANTLAKKIDWDELRGKYRDVLEQLCTPR